MILRCHFRIVVAGLEAVLPRSLRRNPPLGRLEAVAAVTSTAGCWRFPDRFFSAARTTALPKFELPLGQRFWVHKIRRGGLERRRPVAAVAVTQAYDVTVTPGIIADPQEPKLTTTLAASRSPRGK